MDIQAYIQTGIIESYVLGLTSTEERIEVENLRSTHVEIEHAIDDFSLAVEQYALENAITPPEEIKEKILSELQIEEDHDISSTILSVAGKDEQRALVVPYKNMRHWRFLAAASVILLIVSAALNYYLYNQYINRNQAYQALLSERQTLQANNQVYQTKLKEWENASTMISDPIMATVKMHSPKGNADAATVFWNTQNKDVYVMANKLPNPVTGKQYQLWAIVDGKPVDAGVIQSDCTGVCRMKNIPKAQAFAITLEKQGGSPTPHLDALFVTGSI